jgi:hypothetical protein
MSNLLTYFVIGTIFSFIMDGLDHIFGKGDAFSNSDRFKMIATWPIVWVFIIVGYARRKK